MDIGQWVGRRHVFCVATSSGMSLTFSNVHCSVAIHSYVRSIFFFLLLFLFLYASLLVQLLLLSIDIRVAGVRPKRTWKKYWRLKRLRNIFPFSASACVCTRKFSFQILSLDCGFRVHILPTPTMATHSYMCGFLVIFPLGHLSWAVRTMRRCGYISFIRFSVTP